MVGLGNPGPRYAGTRHNIGFDWVDSAVEALDSRAKFSERFQSEWVEIVNDRAEIHFLKPQTFMNESGKAVSEWKKKYPQGLVWVVYDEVDLPLGRIRLKASGSDAGHRGLRSIIERLGTQEIPRLRLGVGRPEGDTIEHVLERFKPGEKLITKKIIQDAGSLLNDYLEWAVGQNNFERAMNLVNARRYET